MVVAGNVYSKKKKTSEPGKTELVCSPYRKILTVLDTSFSALVTISGGWMSVMLAERNGNGESKRDSSESKRNETGNMTRALKAHTLMPTVKSFCPTEKEVTIRWMARLVAKDRIHVVTAAPTRRPRSDQLAQMTQGMSSPR
jgi:hypothetical protein